MATLNERVFKKGFKALTTAVVLSYRRDLHQVRYCSAGHPPILRRSRNGDLLALETPHAEGSNLPFGVAGRTSYTVCDTGLHDGDILMLYSDGLVEAFNRGRIPFGVERLTTALSEVGNTHPTLLKRHVISRVRDWTGGAMDHDDVTLMMIQMDEQGKPHPG